MPNTVEVNPATGEIRPVSESGVYGTPQPTVDIYGNQYQVTGNRLTPVGGPITGGYNLGGAGVSVLTYLDDGRVILTNTISQSGINQSTASGRSYGVSGPINMLLPSGDVVQVDIRNAQLGPTGMRLYVSYGESGAPDYNYVPASISTNAQLQEYVHDLSARFARPDEAIERSLIGYVLSNAFGDLARIAAELDLHLENGDLDISEAARLLIQGNLGTLTATSDYLIQP